MVLPGLLAGQGRLMTPWVDTLGLWALRAGLLLAVAGGYWLVWRMFAQILEEAREL